MALTDYIIMPSADYTAACDKVRERTGKTDPIKSGDLAAEIEGIPQGGGAENDLDLLAQQKLETVNLPNATEIPEGFFEGINGIVTINAPNVKTVKGYGICCTSDLRTEPHDLRVVNIPECIEIHSYAFKNNWYLHTINLSPDYSYGYFLEGTFSGCWNLSQESIDHVINGNANIKRVDNNAFGSCKKITTVNLPNVTSLGQSAFGGCEKLQTFSAPLVTSMGSSCFTGCASLESISLPNFATTLPNYTFSGCTNLKAVDLPRVLPVGAEAFKDCVSLKMVVLPEGNNVGIRAFSGCTNLVLVDLGNSSVPSSPKVNSEGFTYCAALKAVVIRPTNGTYSLGSTNAFTGTPIADGTGYVYFPRKYVDYYKTATNWSTYEAQIRAIEDYTVDGTVTGELDLAKMGIEVTE